MYAQWSGQGVANVDVLVYSDSDSREVHTDRSGRFVVFGLDANRYTVVARGEGYSDRCVRLDVAADESEYAKIVLLPSSVEVDGGQPAIRDGESYIVS